MVDIIIINNIKLYTSSLEKVKEILVFLNFFRKIKWIFIRSGLPKTVHITPSADKI